MKTYKNLYEKLISEENIRVAITNVVKGKLKRHKFNDLKQNPENYIISTRDYIERFETVHHEPKQIYDGVSRKKRTIIVPTLMEQIMHHCIVNILKPIFMKSFYYHSYGSIPGKGMQLAKRYIESYIVNKKSKYCLQMDIRHYFETIPNREMKCQFYRIIKDEKFLSILYKVLDVLPDGLPLGFYTSQWIANWFLTPLDHFIKEKLKADFYTRYMDDMIILGDNKEELHKIKDIVKIELFKIGLELKHNWQIYPISKRFIDVLGYKFYTNKVTLRKKLFYKACRKAKRLSQNITIYGIRQMLSYEGWFCETDTKRAYEKFVKPYVDFNKLSSVISKFDRRLSYELEVK